MVANSAEPQVWHILLSLPPAFGSFILHSLPPAPFFFPQLVNGQSESRGAGAIDSDSASDSHGHSHSHSEK